MSDAGEIVHTPDEWHPYGIDSMQGPDFTEAEARQITTKMNAYMACGFRLLEVAHERKAWAALGYSRFVDYLTAETSWGKSRGFQLLAHARALNMLTAAAGLPEKSTMVDSLIPERVTRDLDVAAVADAVDAAAADLPDDATDGDRAAIVADAVSQALAAVDPGKADTPAPADPEGEQGEPVLEGPAPHEGASAGLGLHVAPPAPSEIDGAGAIPPAPAPSPPVHLETDEITHDDVEGAVRAAEAEPQAGPPVLPSGGIADPSARDRAAAHLDGLVDARTAFRDKTTKAQAKADALLELDPQEIVDTLNADELDDWRSYAVRLSTWAIRLDHAVTEAASPNLRSVQ